MINTMSQNKISTLFRAVLVTSTVLTALTVSGCSTAVTPQGAPSSESAKPSTLSKPTTAATRSCDDILTAEAQKKIVDVGQYKLTNRELGSTDPWLAGLQLMASGGGTVCYWARDNSDLSYTAASATMDAARSDVLKANLLAAGYSSAASAKGDLFTKPDSFEPSLTHPFLFAAGGVVLSADRVEELNNIVTP